MPPRSWVSAPQAAPRNWLAADSPCSRDRESELLPTGLSRLRMQANAGLPTDVASRDRPRLLVGGISMNRFWKFWRDFAASEDGPTAVEYAVMLALIVVVCLVAIQSVGTNAQSTFTNVASSLAS